MARRVRRTHSHAFKAKVASAALKGERTLAEFAQQYDMRPNQITNQKARLAEGAAALIGAAVGAEPALAVDLNLPHAKIGELARENDFLAGALSKAVIGTSAKR